MFLYKTPGSRSWADRIISGSTVCPEVPCTCMQTHTQRRDNSSICLRGEYTESLTDLRVQYNGHQLFYELLMNTSPVRLLILPAASIVHKWAALWMKFTGILQKQQQRLSDSMIRSDIHHGFPNSQTTKKISKKRRVNHLINVIFIFVHIYIFACLLARNRIMNYENVADTATFFHIWNQQFTKTE